jgi:hypothetical protein
LHGLLLCSTARKFAVDRRVPAHSMRGGRRLEVKSILIDSNGRPIDIRHPTSIGRHSLHPARGGSKDGRHHNHETGRVGFSVAKSGFSLCCAVVPDYAEPVIARAFARPVGLIRAADRLTRRRANQFVICSPSNCGMSSPLVKNIFCFSEFLLAA